MLQRPYRLHVHTPALLPLSERMPADHAATGAGVTIAFIDSGFYPHPDIRGRVRLHVDATDEIPKISNARFGRPAWYAWHGQMTSVIACGNGLLSSGRFSGLASRASIVLVKVSTRTRQIKEPDILRGLRWISENAKAANIRIVNVSVGGDFPSDDPDHPLYVLMRQLEAQGVLVVCAGGNGGREHLVPPASASTALTVGGYDDLNSPNPTIWQLYHHDFGRDVAGAQKPDILGPARWIVSPFLPGTTAASEAVVLADMLDAVDSADERAAQAVLNAHHAMFGLPEAAQLHDPEVITVLQATIDRLKLVDGAHQFVDGTSVSAAIVSSIAAQMLEINPSLSPADIRYVLRQTAVHFPDYPHERQGAGCIAGAAAVAAVRKSG